MKSSKLSLVCKVVFFICCCCITTRAEAVCQSEVCGQHPSHPPSCGDGDCTPFINPLYPSYPPENHGNCPADCSITATCGDGVISSWENCNNCPADVPICGPFCGDQVCSSSVGETCLTCGQDCGNCGRCGDGVCDCAPNGLETITNCPQDCTPATTTTSTTTTTTTTTVPLCGNGICAGSETVANCPQDCTCGNGVCAGTETFANCPQDCTPPPTCGNGTCAGTETVANCPQDCHCPAGQTVVSGICCPSSAPYNVNGQCSICPAGQNYFNGVCSACPAGAVVRGGSKAGQCCPVGIPQAVNDPAECCPATSPYVYPDGAGGLRCSACSANQVERGGSKAGQCCPAGIPQALNDPAECCPAATPYVHPDGAGGLMCSASICPAGQVERGGSKAGQCCPAGIPRAANDPAECCPSTIPYVFPDGAGGLVCRASNCPDGQVLVGGVCTVVPICSDHRGTTARYECVTFASLSDCKGVSKGVSRHAYTPDGMDVEVWCSRGSNQGNVTPVINGNVICGCIRVEGCFHPDTQISLLNGTSKKAADISVEDVLLNPLTGNGYQVLSVIESREQAALIEFGYADVKLKVSDGHAVYLKGGKLKKAKDLVVGDKVLGADNNYHSLDFVNSLQVEAGQRVINFNLETDSEDTRDHILLSDGIATGDLYVQGVLKDKK